MVVHGGAVPAVFGRWFSKRFATRLGFKDWKDHGKVIEIQPMTVPTVLSCDDGLGIQMLQIRKSREEVFHFVSHPLLLLWCLGDLGAK